MVSIHSWEGRHCLFLLSRVEILALHVVSIYMVVQVDFLPLNDGESSPSLIWYHHDCQGESLGFPISLWCHRWRWSHSFSLMFVYNRVVIVSKFSVSPVCSFPSPLARDSFYQSLFFLCVNQHFSVYGFLISKSMMYVRKRKPRKFTNVLSLCPEVSSHLSSSLHLSVLFYI